MEEEQTLPTAPKCLTVSAKLSWSLAYLRSATLQKIKRPRHGSVGKQMHEGKQNIRGVT